MKFPYAPTDVCSEKPSTASDMTFLNRALTHTKVACTWDEPEVNNKRNEILFKDDMEDKIDIDDYIAPGIDEGYDPDEDEEGSNGNEDVDVSIDEGASSSDEEEVEDLPKKKLKTTGQEKPIAASKSDNKTFVFSDFDKKNRKKLGGLKIIFKNPLEMGVDTDDNPLGKRIYSLKFAEKKNKHPADEEDAPNDFFTGETAEYNDKNAELS